MAVISRIPMVAVMHFGALETMGTIFLCYVLAVSLGHVPAWLPMISDCAVYPPEKYPFRLGLVVGAVILALSTVVVYQSDRSFSNSKLGLVLGIVGSAGLSVVAVVNEDENPPVHGTAAVTFFVCYDLYMNIMTAFVYQESRTTFLSLVVKLTCATVGVACIGLLFAIVAHLVTGSIYLAVFEWSNTLAIAFFIWSFALDDLPGVDLSIVREAGDSEEKILPDKNRSALA